jgi:hypothetical protein
VSCCGGRIALVEGVDPFLDADARRVGQVAIGDEPLGDRVARGVDVHRERRDLVLVRVGDGFVPGSWNVTPSYGDGSGRDGGWVGG